MSRLVHCGSAAYQPTFRCHRRPHASTTTLLATPWNRLLDRLVLNLWPPVLYGPGQRPTVHVTLPPNTGRSVTANRSQEGFQHTSRRTSRASRLVPRAFVESRTAWIRFKVTPPPSSLHRQRRQNAMASMSPCFRCSQKSVEA